VSPAAVTHFRHLAEKLVTEKDVTELLAAALAVVSGNSDIKQRSLLSSREVMITRKTFTKLLARAEENADCLTFLLNWINFRLGCLTLCCSLLPYEYSYKASCARPS